jgi:hypothetical protein
MRVRGQRPENRGQLKKFRVQALACFRGRGSNLKVVL